jgi:hypothetical protein
MRDRMEKLISAITKSTDIYTIKSGVKLIDLKRDFLLSYTHLDHLIEPLLDDYIKGFIKYIPVEKISDLYMAEGELHRSLKELDMAAERTYFVEGFKYWDVFELLRYRFAHLATLKYLTKDKITKTHLRRALYIIRDSGYYINELSHISSRKYGNLYNLRTTHLKEYMVDLANAIKDCKKMSIREYALNSILD